MKYLLTILILGTAKADHDYFEYDDCGEACTVQRSSCTIAESTEGNFIIECISSEDCRARETNTIVCLIPGEAPTGGIDLWPEFKRLVHPTTTTPPPEIQSNCRTWEVMSGVSWGCSGIAILVFTVRKVLRKIRQRNRFERVVSEDNPYQPTVQDVLEEEG